MHWFADCRYIPSFNLPKSLSNRTTELVTRLLHHRSRPRIHNHHPLRCSLLQILLQATPPQINGHPRPRPLRPLPRPTTFPIRTQHPRIRSHVTLLLHPHEIPSLPTQRLLKRQPRLRSRRRPHHPRHSIRRSKTLLLDPSQALRAPTTSYQDPWRDTEVRPEWIRCSSTEERESN